MYVRMLAAVLAGVMLSACAPAPPAVDAAAEEQAIRAISAAWLAAEQAKDAGAILANFAPDASVSWSGQEPAAGHDAIRAVIEKSWADDPNAKISWSTDSVHIAASGDMAVELGSWSTTGAGPDGTGTDQGRYITYYRKIDGAWKVAADNSSSSTPR